MTVPQWWSSNRYGLFVHASLATVPSWAPIGQYAEWYQSHLGEAVDDVGVHPTPMVEVLAHHRRRWSHVDSYVDFAELLTFDRFDPDQWAEIAVAAGMSSTVMVAKHHDGLRWWDAPGDVMSALHTGPRRNVLAEWACAARRHGLVFGTYYSLLDWSDRRYPSRRYVDEVLHREVLDLVDRYGSQVLWGDGHGGHGPETWRSDELIDRARELVSDIVVNDRWWSSNPDFRTFQSVVPPAVVSEPWELCLPIASSFGYNRNERSHHHLDAPAIISLLTEVVAKGGNLLLNVGPDVHGMIPEHQREPLLEAGVWIRAHRDLIDSARPWHPIDDPVWGDAHVRFIHTAADHADTVTAIDLGHEGHFAALDDERFEIIEVTALDGGDIDIDRDRSGVRIRRVDRRPTQPASLYRIRYRVRAQGALELFSADEIKPLDLASAVADARSGDVIVLGEADYLAPAVIPDGVVVRGLGPARTRIVAAPHSSTPDHSTLVTLGRGSRLEHLEVVGAAGSVPPAVTISGDGALLLGVRITGETLIVADRVVVRGSELDTIRADAVDRIRVSRSTLRGNRWNTGVWITGGTGHEIEGCEFVDHLCAIRLDGTQNATIRGNDLRARWWAAHLKDTTVTHVVANSISATMRAVDVDGGVDVVVDGNAVSDGDSGCIVEHGATSITVSGNHWSRCRIGLLVWDAGDVIHRGNVTVDLYEPDRAVEIGPS